MKTIENKKKLGLLLFIAGIVSFFLVAVAFIVSAENHYEDLDSANDPMVFFLVLLKPLFYFVFPLVAIAIVTTRIGKKTFTKRHYFIDKALGKNPPEDEIKMDSKVKVKKKTKRSKKEPELAE